MKQEKKYNHEEIEKKWRDFWLDKKLYSPNLDLSEEKQEQSRLPYYNLWMFPYPSGEGLHVGHFYASTGSDIHGRYKRMKENMVFQPIGYDAFGIHSENYALKIGTHPKDLIEKTTKRYEYQLKETGNAYDWDRTVNTANPDYYKWTQWLFVQMFKNGLAYRKKAEVNWCPSCKTVLADEQVIKKETEEGVLNVCERCDTEVEKKQLEQWFFRITDYADRLLEGLNKIDWPEKIKNAQKNWIGRSEGALINFDIKCDSGHKVDVFTTRPDTIFGVTFLVLSPENPIIKELLAGKFNVSKEIVGEVGAYVKRALQKTKDERRHEKEKTGVFTGLFAQNPISGEGIPVYVADYVLKEYGTGAVMGVPAHDQRDFEFAKKYNLDIKEVILAEDDIRLPKFRDFNVEPEDLKKAFEGYGVLVNSGQFNGEKSGSAKKKIIKYLEEKGAGRQATTYHLRDWLISRQRYWGPPIPMIFCEACAKEGKGERDDMPGWYSVPQKGLPVLLPYIENYQPKGSGESPLAQDKEWVNVKCPVCGGEGRRETDVSDTFLDSSWYFLRYLATDWQDIPFPSPKFKDTPRSSWLPVNMYVGGAEHSVLHLLYVRFVTMSLRDWGYLDFEEPFPHFYAHGMIIKEGAKMSKSRGNVVVPDEYVHKYGADTLRCYMMFLGPLSQGGDFYDTGVEGMHRFIKRVWNLLVNKISITDKEEDKDTIVLLNKTIKEVTHDIEDFSYNTALARMMEFYNHLSEKKLVEGKGKAELNKDVVNVFLKLLAPLAPYMTEEIYHLVNGEEAGSIHFEKWPEYDKSLLVAEEVLIVVQVNGKRRAEIKVPTDKITDQSFVEQLSKEAASKYIAGDIKKTIYVKGKIINFVI